ncbi:aminotransferase class I/II-fold pyridoxal phosphate-dependent enzyme [Candidatus Vidania fulgoroideorum]
MLKLFYKMKIKNINGKIKKASSIIFKNYNLLKIKEKKKKISYGTHGSEISKKLCNQIKRRMKAKYVLLNPSGLNSIFLCYFSLLKNKENILIHDNIYEPNKLAILNISKKYNIKVFLCNPYLKFNELKKNFKNKKIKIFFIESPGSITFEIPYIKDILKFCKKYNIISIIDDTYSSGVYFKPLDLGFDISIHAITKFYSGGNDVLMGACITNKKKIYKILNFNNRIMGVYVDQFDCYLVIRSMKTMDLRYKIHSKNCIKVINFLKKFKFIKKIIYPFDKKSKNSSNWKKYFKYNGGLFSIVFKKKILKKKIIKFVNSLKLFKIAYSWGGVNSLVMIYEKVLSNRLNFKKYKKRIIVRFFVGLEKIKNIINDIKYSIKYLL